MDNTMKQKLTYIEEAQELWNFVSDALVQDFNNELTDKQRVAKQEDFIKLVEKTINKHKTNE